MATWPCGRGRAPLALDRLDTRRTVLPLWPMVRYGLCAEGTVCALPAGRHVMSRAITRQPDARRLAEPSRERKADGLGGRRLAVGLASDISDAFRSDLFSVDATGWNLTMITGAECVRLAFPDQRDLTA